MPEKQEKSDFVFEDKRVYRRHWLKTIIRVFFALIILMLNITTVLSDIERHGKHVGLSWEQEVFMFFFLLLIDATILIPILFEVHSVEVTPEKATFQTLFFRKGVPWDNIVKFKQWRYVVYALVRTPRCFYLINRRDIKGFPDLAQTIMERATSTKS